ncbi:hypothetical protein Tco_1325625 [Tanacetum coccineum]
MRRKERVVGNVLDAVIQIISLAIVQNHLATKIKRLSLEVLGAIARMTPKTKLMMKLVSWLNPQMSSASTPVSTGRRVSIFTHNQYVQSVFAIIVALDLSKSNKPLKAKVQDLFIRDPTSGTKPVALDLGSTRLFLCRVLDEKDDRIFCFW